MKNKCASIGNFNIFLLVIGMRSRLKKNGKSVEHLNTIKQGNHIHIVKHTAQQQKNVYSIQVHRDIDCDYHILKSILSSYTV